MKIHLVNDWRRAWRWASVRLAAVASIVLAYLWAAPDQALLVLNAMPAETRAYLSPVVGIIIFIGVTATRVIHKKKDDLPAAKAGCCDGD